MVSWRLILSDYLVERRSSFTMVESGCTGKGSNTSGRVAWVKSLSSEEIAKFVDVSYVSDDGWLAAQPS